MDYIILDLEWNQSKEGKEGENKDLPFEIIEIGAVKMNSKKEMISEFSQLIKPEVYTEMHHVTKKIIHLQIEELEKGRPFTEVIREFLDWCGDDFIFGTWGSLDLLELQRNMKYFGIAPFSEGPLKYLDIQKLFSIAYEDKKSRRALEFAVDYLKIEKDIPFHRAFSDAYYTAKIFYTIQDRKIEENYSFDYFALPKTRKEEIHVTFSEYAKYISQTFEDKAEALNDREVTSTKCYLCNKNAKRKIRWFSSNGKHYYCVSHCEKHGYMKGKIRLKKSEDDKVYVVKTLKLISEEQMKEIRYKRERTKQ